MIAQLKKRLSTFLSSVIAVILAAMSILLLHTVIKEYTNSTHVSYSRDVNLLYSYLEQVSILDIPILTEYSEKNLNIDVLRNSNTVMSTNSFAESAAVLEAASPYSQPMYWDDYYNAVNQGETNRRFYTVRYNHIDYWNSYSIINIGGTFYTIHTVFNNAVLSAYKTKIIILFLLITSAAIILLSIFSCIFTVRILVPVNKAYQKQDMFIAVASHELKTPITIIKSCLNGLSGSKPNETDNDYILTAQRECDRMTDMVNNLLTFADIKKSGRDNFDEVHPEDIIIDCYDRFEPIAIQKNVDLVVSIPDDPLPLLSMDRDRMLQCMSILVDNAISCTSKGAISMSVSMRDQRLCYQISDTGDGISDEDKPHIFETFYSGRNDHRTHFGLGLSIAKSIADLHSADLTVCDNIPHGSIFTLTFKL